MSLIVIALVLLVLARAMPRGEPWQFTFKRNTVGQVDLFIAHGNLGIHGVTIKTDAVAPVDFNDRVVLMRNASALPAGKVLFSDFTRLPGRVRIEIGTHTIDVMPGGMLIDGAQYSWERARQNPIDLGVGSVE